MPSHPGVKKLRDMLNRPGFIYALGIWDPYTARVSESMGMQCVHIGGYQLGIGNVTSEPLITLTELAYTTRMVSNAVTQELKRVLTNFRNTGASGLPAKEMIAWRKECETLIGLDEMYKVERDTVER